MEQILKNISAKQIDEYEYLNIKKSYLNKCETILKDSEQKFAASFRTAWTLRVT